MFHWPRKKRKRWRAKYQLESYSTAELQRFLQIELDAISYRAPRLWEHIQNAARLETEISRRTTSIK